MTPAGLQDQLKRQEASLLVMMYAPWSQASANFDTTFAGLSLKYGGRVGLRFLKLNVSRSATASCVLVRLRGVSGACFGLVSAIRLSSLRVSTPDLALSLTAGSRQEAGCQAHQSAHVHPLCCSIEHVLSKLRPRCLGMSPAASPLLAPVQLTRDPD